MVYRSASKNLCRIALSLSMIVVLTSANRHLQTSADPDTRLLRIPLSKETLVIGLDTPGMLIQKYGNGRLRSASFHQVNTHYRITFHPEMRYGSEQVATIQRLEYFDDMLLPQGKTQSYSPSGVLLTEQNWKSGKLHGEQLVYNASMQLIDKREYDEGHPVGQWLQYYANGKLARELSFPESATMWEETKGTKPGAGVPVGSMLALTFRKSLSAVETWYSQNGARIRSKVLRLYKDDQHCFVVDKGQSTEYYPNGALKSRTHSDGPIEAIDSFFRYDGHWYHKHSHNLHGRTVESYDQSVDSLR